MRQPAELKKIDGVPVVELFGEADLASVGALNSCFSLAERIRSPGVVVSLLHAEYFDSSTIHTLVSFGEHLKASGRRLFIVGPSGESGRRILSIFGIAGRTPVFDTVPEAVAHALVFSADSPNDASTF